MRQFILLAIATLAAVSVGSHPSLPSIKASQPPDQKTDRRQILENYEAVRAAHFQHDAAAFLAGNDANWLQVSDGTIVVHTIAEEKPRVQKYFDSVKFSEITDLDPPRVEVSSDGTMAWFLGHVRVRGIQHNEKGVNVPLAFDAAWINVLQKKDGVWRVVARANTEKDTAVSH